MNQAALNIAELPPDHGMSAAPSRVAPTRRSPGAAAAEPGTGVDAAPAHRSTIDCKRGRDLDLYIETDIAESGRMFRQQMALLAALHIKLGEQTIDLVVKQRGQTTELPIHRVASETAVRL